MTMTATADHIAEPSLRPNLVVLTCGTAAVALLSFLYLPWPLAIAASLLGVLMVAGADVDARLFLLPDTVTYGALVSGLIAVPLLEAMDPWRSMAIEQSEALWQSIGIAILRAAGTALVLYLLRLVYARLRKTEGLGLGDVKLAAAAGAWLPLDTIPMCFGLATTAALVSVLFRGRKEALEELKLPFGAFLCPALWFVFFVSSLPH